MKSKPTLFLRRYCAELQKYLKHEDRPAGLLPETVLGRRAMTIGLVTLDLARIHNQVLMTLGLPDDSAATRKGLVRRARTFFTRVVNVIEKTHSATEVAKVQPD